MSSWTKFGGHSDEFFKFEDEGDELEGVWLGTKTGKYESLLGRIRTKDGREVAFSLSRALEDLELVPRGTEIKIVFTGWQATKNGTKFKAFELFTRGEVEPVERRRERFEAKSEDVPF